MVAQATLLLFGSFFVMLLAGVPISAGIGIASIFTALFSMDLAIFALTAAQRCFSGIDSFSLLALPFFSLGGNIMNKDGILAGFFTATEAGVVLCLYCGLLSILYKEMTLKSFYNLLADTMESSATILFLIAASSIMSYVMSYSGIPAAISNALMSVSSNRYVILLIVPLFASMVVALFLVTFIPAISLVVPYLCGLVPGLGWTM